jgi:pyruvate formate lyase activating enzyme
MPLTEGTIDETEVFGFFEKRKDLLDALVITGGEPTLYGQELVLFSIKFKDMFPDKLLKIDTNGSNPKIIYELSTIADFCAMDLKSDSYDSFSDLSISTISESLEMTQSFPEHEIRITCYPKYIDKEKIKSIIEILKKAKIKEVVLQQ